MTESVQHFDISNEVKAEICKGYIAQTVLENHTYIDQEGHGRFTARAKISCDQYNCPNINWGRSFYGKDSGSRGAELYAEENARTAISQCPYIVQNTPEPKQNLAD